MSRKFSLSFILIGILLILSACSTSGSEVPTQVTISEPPIIESVSPTFTATVQLPDAQAAATPRPFSPAHGGALIADKNEFFTAAGNCVLCHKNNIDEAGNDVSIGEYWRSSMMANSAKDPYYLAGISMNIDSFPEFGAAMNPNAAHAICPWPISVMCFMGKKASSLAAKVTLILKTRFIIWRWMVFPALLAIRSRIKQWVNFQVSMVVLR